MSQANFDHLHVIRECCRDEAAFAKLHHLLRLVVQSYAQSEEALRLSEAQNRALINAIPDLMFRIGRDGSYLDFKTNHASDFAIEPSEMIGKKVGEVLPPDVAEQRMYYVAKALETGEMQVFEYQLLNHGEMHIYEARIVVSGKDEVLAIVRDITERKRSERQLQQTTDDLQAIFQAFPDLQFRLDADGHVLDYHAGATTELFVPPEVFLGRRVQELLPTLAGQQINAAIERVKATKSLVSVEYALPAPGTEFDQTSEAGRELQYEARLLPLLENQIMAIIRDVTEQKRAEEALRISEEKFSRAFRASPDSITISTINGGRILEVNDSFIKITGYSREEVIGRTSFELGIWNNPKDSAKMRQTLRERGMVHNLECEFRTKSKDILIGLISAEIVEINGEQCILAITNDITERKKAQLQLQTAQERDRILAEIALRIRRSLNLDQILHTTVAEVREFLQADRVFIAYSDGNLRGKIMAESVDFRWSSILGWVADNCQVTGIEADLKKGPLLIDDVSRIELPTAAHCMFEQHQVKASMAVPILQGDQFFGALVAQQCSGPRHWQQYEIDLLEKLSTQVAIAIQQAELYEQVQTLNSNLELQVQERTLQLQQKLQELQKLGELKDFFFHAVSHDLRTPIMGMVLVLKNLLKNLFNKSATTLLASPDQQELNQPQECVLVPRSVLERMIQSSDRQLNMLNLLLDTHALETGSANLQREKWQLSTLIDSVIVDMEPLLIKNEAKLTSLVTADLPLIDADVAQIRRVFENLINNALQHNPPGLQITIDAGMVEECDESLHPSAPDPITANTNNINTNNRAKASAKASEVIADRSNIKGFKQRFADCPNRQAQLSPVKRIHCRLQDNGLGMEDSSQLFERYARGKHARYSTGIGLGLYLCQQIVTAHGGKIGVVSSPGNGAVFWFTLPIATEI